MQPSLADYTQSERFKRILSLNCAIFVYLFLVFFQPFGVNNYEPNNAFAPDLFLGILPVIPVFYFSIYLSEKYLRPVLLNRLNFNLYTWFISEFILLGSLNFLLYNALGNFHDFHWKSYLFHIFEVSSVLIFPFTATIFYFRFKYLERNFQNMLSVSEKESNLDRLIHLSGDYKKDQIALKPSQIIRIESEDNYVGLHYLDVDTAKKYLIRSSLSKMQETLDPDFFIRCNRSNLVNLIHLKTYKMKSNRLWLKLDHVEEEICVSRSNDKEVLDRIKSGLLK